MPIRDSAHDLRRDKRAKPAMGLEQPFGDQFGVGNDHGVPTDVQLQRHLTRRGQQTSRRQAPGPDRIAKRRDELGIERQ